jgi:hypothetical protein
VSDADVVGGFLHIPFNSPVRIFLHLPRNLPHPFAGMFLEIHHAIYGLQESNRLFSLEMTKIIVEDAVYVTNPSEPQQFLFVDPKDSGRKCVVNVTVDDLLFVTNVPVYRDKLIAALTLRFGPLTLNLESVMHTGIEMTRLSNGGILLTQDQAIARAASVVGVSHLPPVDVPTDRDTFFLPSFDGDENLPVSAEEYSSVTGRLVHFVKTRTDCRLFVSYLCGFNHAPLEGHF